MACLVNITKKYLRPEVVCSPSAVTHRVAYFCEDFTTTDEMCNRLEKASVVFCKDHGLFLFGGYFDEKPSNLVYNLKYYEAYPHWKRFQRGLKVARAFHSALLINGELIYLSGGQSNNMKVVSSVECASLKEMDNHGLKWGLELDLNSRRYDHCMIESNETMYVIGGRDKKGNYLKSVEMFTEGGFFPTWETCKEEMAIPRAGFSAVCKHNCVYLIGGKSDDKTEIKTISILDLPTMQTTNVADIPPELDSFVAGFDLETEYIYVVGRGSRNRLSEPKEVYGHKSPLIKRHFDNPKYLEVPTEILKPVDLIQEVPDSTLEASTSAFDQAASSSQMDKPHSPEKTPEQDSSEEVQKSRSTSFSESLLPSVEKTSKRRRSPPAIIRSAVTWVSKKLSPKDKRVHPQIASPLKRQKTDPKGGLPKEMEKGQRYGLEDPIIPTGSTGLRSEVEMNRPESRQPESYEATTSKSSTTRLQLPAASSEESPAKVTSEDTAQPTSTESSSSGQEPRTHLEKEFPQPRATLISTSEIRDAMLVTMKKFAEERKDPESHDRVMRYNFEKSGWDKGFSVPYYGHSERWSLVVADKPQPKEVMQQKKTLVPMAGDPRSFTVHLKD